MVYATWPIECVVGFTPQLSTVRIRWKPTRKLASAVGTAIYNTDLWPNGAPEELVWQPNSALGKMRKYEYANDISYFISAEKGAGAGAAKKATQIYVWIAWKETDEPVDAIASRFDLMSDESWICGEVPMEFRMWMSMRGGNSVAAIPAMIAVPIAPMAAPPPPPPIARLQSLPAPITPRAASPPRPAAAASAAKRRRIVELAERAQFADLSEVERVADTIEALVACGALKYADAADSDDIGRGAPLKRTTSVDAKVQTADAAQDLVTIAEANKCIVAAQQRAMAIAVAHERAAHAAEAYARNVLCQRIYQQLATLNDETCGQPTNSEMIAAEMLNALKATSA